MLLPRETYSLDVKSDDGHPTTGKLTNRQGVNLFNCFAGNTYNLTLETLECGATFGVD